ncbi:MAG: thermonuclease family protein [Spirochaetes bacterium]|nr:thermonuclease family protein [Spirochaetota bacterium]
MVRFFLILFFAFYLPLFALDKLKVDRIVDGDTIVVVQNGNREKVRFIGIDAPESRVNDKTIKDSKRTDADVKTLIIQGKKATAFLKSVLRKGDFVTVEYDIQKRDKYGRILAYVFLPDGRMLNDLIIRSGYAYPLTIPPNIKYADKFLQSYKYARDKKLGLWSGK